MAMTTHLDIVSAEESIYSGLTEMVTCTGSLGELGIAPGHAPLLTKLRPGPVTVRYQGGEEDIFYVSGGMLETRVMVPAFRSGSPSNLPLPWGVLG